MTSKDVLDRFRSSARCSRGTSACRPACTARATCSARSCCSTPRTPRRSGAALARRASARLCDAPTVVLSPALGGLIIGHEVARALGVRAIFAERAGRRAHAAARASRSAAADRVLIVEDVVTTGGSTRETMEVARRQGAAVVAAAAVINRSGRASPVDVPFAALAALTPPTYEPEACPLCAAGEPVAKPGSRTAEADSQ